MEKLSHEREGQAAAISLRLPTHLDDTIRAWAKAAGLTISQTNRLLIEGALQMLEIAEDNPNIRLSPKLEEIMANHHEMKSRPLGGGSLRISESKVSTNDRIDKLEMKLNDVLQVLDKNSLRKAEAEVKQEKD